MVLQTPPGGRMITASDQAFNPTLMAMEPREIIAKRGRMNEVALFAGAGGGLLGTRLLGWETVCYVENNPYCIEVLKARIKDGCLDDAPIWDDVRTFRRETLGWIGGYHHCGLPVPAV